MKSIGKHAGILGVAVLVMAAMLVNDADAARVGGGRSIGAQRPSVTPRASAPAATQAPGAASQPVMPATPGATLPAKPVAPAATPSAGSRWLGPIAGLAAGLGLAALFSHFGMGEGMGSFFLIALLVIGGVLIVRMLLARRAQPQQQQAAYAGASPTSGTSQPFEMPRAPQWGGSARVEPVLAPPPSGKSFPPGFDVDGFVRQAKLQFARLQAAHDARDRAALKDVLTPEMLAEVEKDFAAGPVSPLTEVVTLNAELLEVQTEGNAHWASVRFSGTMREDGAATPVAFDEVWNLSKPVDGSSGWLLAGIQQMA